MRYAFLTFFYTGLSPKAPGTMGSIAGVIVAFGILQYFSTTTLFLAFLLVTAISINEINTYEKETKIHDHKSIVIDEVVGVWLAIIISYTNIYSIVFALVYFRIFDIWKPSVIGRVDRQVKGGLGVVGDDLLAGFFAGICTLATMQFLDKFEIIKSINTLFTNIWHNLNSKYNKN